MRVLVLLPFGLSLLRVVTLAAGPGIGFGEANRLRLGHASKGFVWWCEGVSRTPPWYRRCSSGRLGPEPRQGHFVGGVG